MQRVQHRNSKILEGKSMSDAKNGVWAATNDRGHVIGEHHPRAKLTDADVGLVLDLRDAGLSYAQIAAKFDDGMRIGKQTIADICQGRTRRQTVMGHKRVRKTLAIAKGVRILDGG